MNTNILYQSNQQPESLRILVKENENGVEQPSSVSNSSLREVNSLYSVREVIRDAK